MFPKKKKKIFKKFRGARLETYPFVFQVEYAES
jgi:hypothetical protein